MKLWQIVVCIALLLVAGCGDSGHHDFGDGLTDEQFGIDFADRAVTLWLGTDYTYGGDGSSGIDGAGTVFAIPRMTGKKGNTETPSAL